MKEKHNDMIMIGGGPGQLKLSDQGVSTETRMTRSCHVKREGRPLGRGNLRDNLLADVRPASTEKQEMT